jgi:hypothetical protein
MTDGRPIPVRPVSVTIRGVTYRGTYFVDRSVVYVRSRLGIKAIQVGESSPKTVAKLLLSELAAIRRRTREK